MSPGGNQFASAPFYTLNEQGKKGMGRRQCTREYKITPIAKKIREIFGLKPRQRFPKDKHIEVWVGISTDEVMRMKPSRFWWQENRWPLIEKKMSRQDCLKWYEGKGFKIPVKSACIGCPFHDDNFWIDMRNNRPEEFASAVEFDKKMRMHNPKVKNFVHRSCVPLDEVKFKNDDGPDLFNQECEGLCGVSLIEVISFKFGQGAFLFSFVIFYNRFCVKLKVSRNSYSFSISIKWINTMI